MDVLIIEDEPGVQRVMMKALEHAGFMVKTVDNGLAAVAELQRTSFRVIVSDVGLPFLEGKSLYDHLKSDLPEMAERVLFVTGMANDPDTHKFLTGSGRPFLAKPFDMAELVKAVREVAGHARRPSKPG